MAVARIWADKIIAGKKTYAKVPSKLKDAVADALIEKGHPELIIEDKNSKK
jgi:hypothetical protein